MIGRRSPTETERTARAVGRRAALVVLAVVSVLFGAALLFVKVTSAPAIEQRRLVRQLQAAVSNIAQLQQCQQEYDAATSHRSNVLAAQNAITKTAENEWAQASEALFATIPTDPSQRIDPVKFRAALVREKAAAAARDDAEKAYAQAVKANPVPEAPQYACQLQPVPGVPLPTPSHQSLGTPGATSTVVVTRTSVAPGSTQTVTRASPGPVRTVAVPGPTTTTTRQVPGPAVTVTRTRTVPGPIITICIGPLGLPCHR